MTPPDAAKRPSGLVTPKEKMQKTPLLRGKTLTSDAREMGWRLDMCIAREHYVRG